MANIDNYTIKAGWGTQFKAAAKFPVIANRIFETLAQAQAYIESTAADASAIPGLVLTVIEDTNTTNNGAYLVTGTDGNLSLTKLSDVNSAGGDNIIEQINVNDTKQEPVNKVVNITVPTKVSQLDNDSSFATITDSAVTVVKLTDGYQIKQGGTELGTITIPKDMVVSGGRIVSNPDGQNPGTYIELTLANVPEPNNKLYINVQDLVDVYVANNQGHSVSINITDYQVSADINDGAVTEAKLGQDVKNTLAALATGLSGAVNDIDALENKLGWENIS